MTVMTAAYQWLEAKDCVLVLVDIQGKLAQLMHEKERLFSQLQRMVKGALLFDIPILWMEQLPEKLGSTIPEITELLPDLRPIPKHAFSCYGEPRFVEALQKSGRKRVLLTGIESHVCVYQSAYHLIEAGYDVTLINDAISSRDPANRELGLQRMQALGATPSSVEMVLFELQKEAAGERFKPMAQLFK
ncbi:hydrolase [Hahella sp. KA22]|uniref:hydrolase n=1 Tax=Hahella sp. KA22 TaxID=1628392 RepID=UPI001F4F09C0|nr:hydrolase [Hahella sp. KA22]